MPDSVEDYTATLTLTDEKGSILYTWELDGKKSFRIGRSNANDIPLPYTWVSRHHAMIQIESNGFHSAIDLGSSNGTFVNGKRIFAPTLLRSGDRIQIGSKTNLIFLQENAPLLDDETLEEIDEKTVAFLEKDIVTVLVCDIRKFTTLSELLGDRPISNLLKEWTSRVSDIVNQNNGHVDKFIGDAVMATWIGKDIVKEGVHSGLRAALDISRATDQLSDSISSMPFRLRVGGALNTGEAVLGNIGVDGRRDFTVVGDVVNLTFRLEGMNTTYNTDLMLGKEAANQLDQENLKAFFTSLNYTVKGKKDQITAFGCSFDNLAAYLTQSD